MDITAWLTLIFFALLIHITTSTWTLAHCLTSCNPEDKTAYTLAILLCPFGWIIYWLLKPYVLSERNNAPRHRHQKREIDYTEELLQPHTIAPCEQAIIADREAKAVIANAQTAGKVKPPSAKPLHVIAHERKATQPPFATS